MIAHGIGQYKRSDDERHRDGTWRRRGRRDPNRRVRDRLLAPRRTELRLERAVLDGERQALDGVDVDLPDEATRAGWLYSESEHVVEVAWYYFGERIEAALASGLVSKRQTTQMYWRAQDVAMKKLIRHGAGYYERDEDAERAQEIGWIIQRWLDAVESRAHGEAEDARLPPRPVFVRGRTGCRARAARRRARRSATSTVSQSADGPPPEEPPSPLARDSVAAILIAATGCGWNSVGGEERAS
jgi:hypothetical protein